ncbi:O-methyltransferase [Saccharopolyspora taberi]|uniref:O-methyltransferase n=1 Tax=Saccharopolyspora taberi TaxID=60895 RepID=A0ABN3VJJ8_9PSEU
MIPETPIGAGPVGRDAMRSGPPRTGAVPAQDDAGEMTPGHVLRFLAAALRAKAVVEIGTGTGAHSLWLLRGMVPEGVLTSIDVDQAGQRAARAALTGAGIPAGRARLITGLPTDVMSRLTEGGYDLVSVFGARTDYPVFLELGLRLLRPGGVIVFAGVRADDDARRDPASLALRELLRLVRSDETLVPVRLPVGEGLLAVART